MAAWIWSTTQRRAGLIGSFAAALVCGMVNFAGGDDATYTLRYKFQPEQFLYFEVDNPQKIVTQYKGVSQSESNHTQLWKQLRVISVDDAGNALLEPMIDRVKMSATKDGEEAITYDSFDSAPPPFQFQAVKESVGKVVARMNVSATGELLQVIPIAQNHPALIEAARKNDPQLNFLVVLPKTPLRIGESWKDNFKSEVTVDKSLKQNVTIQRTYTLSAVNGTIASIKLKTSVIPPTDDPQIQMQLIERTPSGLIEFDLNRGLIVSMKTQTDETVFNPFGPNSSLSATTRTVEKLLPSRPEFKSASQKSSAVK